MNAVRYTAATHRDHPRQINLKPAKLFAHSYHSEISHAGTSSRNRTC